MEVKGQLVMPELPPCPGANDLEGPAKDDSCNPIQQHDPEQFSGWECCNYWENSPNIWCNDVVRTDQINPEKFKYDQFRYQLYAKPQLARCRGQKVISGIGIQTKRGLRAPDRKYIPPTTDIRPLQQTMYIPIIPTKPGGERDVTFPMTPRTMGQPDVTTACCVPVMPCLPGYRNLTDHIYPSGPDLCAEAQPDVKCPFLAHAGPPKPTAIATPNNARAYPYVGVPDTFPPSQTLSSPYNLGAAQGNRGPAPFQPPHSEFRNIPNYTGELPQNKSCVGEADNERCMDDIDDGTGSETERCTSAKVFNHTERVKRRVMAIQETPEERDRRLHSMFGAYGANMEARPTTRRPLVNARDNIKLQGNGFQWDYPKHENRLCYMLERNPRC